jgi:hypothetical protein
MILVSTSDTVPSCRGGRIPTSQCLLKRPYAHPIPLSCLCWSSVCLSALTLIPSLRYQVLILSLTRLPLAKNTWNCGNNLEHLELLRYNWTLIITPPYDDVGSSNRLPRGCFISIPSVAVFQGLFIDIEIFMY